MAKCRECGTEIPDGAEYCEACMSKLNTAKDSESYLDSLLNAVMKEEPERRENVFPKKEANSLVSMPKNEPEEDTVSAPVMSETEEASAFVMPEIGVPEAEEPEDDGFEMPEIAIPALEFPEDAEFVMPQIAFPEDAQEEEAEEPPMEEAFGTFFVSDGEELPDLNKYSIFDEVDEASVNRMLEEDLQEDSRWDEEEPQFFSEEDADAVPEVFEEEETELSAEPDDFADLFVGGEESSPSDDGAEADLFTFAEEGEGEAEPVSEFGDFADLFAGGEENFTSADSTEDGLPEFGDGADNDLPEFGAEGVENVLDPEFADLLSGFGEDDGGLFEFGAEPVELDASDEVAATVAAATEAKGSEKKQASGDKKEKGESKLVALYHKLFDNVKVDPSKIKPEPTKEELEAQKKAKQEEKERSKEEKEAALAEKKEQERQVKLEKQRVRNEAKAEKKARKMAEAKLLLEEMQATRINRAGASIVFVFFALIGVGIIWGTGAFSYSISIKNAEYEFKQEEYTRAYNEIYGLEIKGEDMMLYDRIMTVMYVQKQLNSYTNYYGMKDYPRALDSLLKGLQRYEKYIDLAVELDIDTDLDSVRKKILMEISTRFFMTEQEAMEIIQSGSQVEYSEKVYEAVEGLKFEE